MNRYKYVIQNDYSKSHHFITGEVKAKTKTRAIQRVCEQYDVDAGEIISVKEVHIHTDRFANTEFNEHD